MGWVVCEGRKCWDFYIFLFQLFNKIRSVQGDDDALHAVDYFSSHIFIVLEEKFQVSFVYIFLVLSLSLLWNSINSLLHSQQKFSLFSAVLCVQWDPLCVENVEQMENFIQRGNFFLFSWRSTQLNNNKKPILGLNIKASQSCDNFYLLGEMKNETHLKRVL